MKNNLLKNRGIGITLSYINTGLNMICGLLISSLLLRLLGNTEYGLYKTMSSFAGMLVMFEFGTGTVMTRNITLCKRNNVYVQKNISTIFGITSVLAITISIFSAIFYCLIDDIYRISLTYEQIVYSKKIFVFVTIQLLVVFFAQTLNGIVLAYEFYSFSSIMNIVDILSRTVLFALIIGKYKYALLVSIIDVFIKSIILIITFRFCKKVCHIKFTYKLFDKTIFMETLPLCCAIFLQTIVNQMNNNVDNFLIGIKLSPESVSLYSVALYIYTIFSSATTIPISLYAPQVVGDVAKGLKGKKLTDSLVQPSRLIVLVGGNILFGFIAVGKEFLEIIYGQQYIDAWIVALLLMIPMFVNMTSGVLVNVLDALNKRMARSNILILTTIINLLLTLLWLEKWGIIGAACATAVSTIIGQVILMHIYYSKKIGIHVIRLFYRSYKGIIVYQVLGMSIALIIKMYFDNIFISFIVGGIVYILISGGGYIFLGCNNEEKDILTKILKIIKKEKHGRIR